jgi:carbon-monoxide dehydrogenase large subunit
VVPIRRSPLAHARIRAINTSRALALDGVRAVITARDIPDRLWGRRLQDVPVLAQDRVRFIGEKVAAVAADDAQTAERAAALVDVDYQELPAVFDAETSLRGDVG